MSVEPSKNNPMQNQEDKQKEMPLHERLQEKRTAVIYGKLKNNGFEDKEALFLSSLFKLITQKVHENPETEPRNCHVFCYEISDEMSISQTDVQGIITTLNDNDERPYKYIATNRDGDFGGFRATDHFVDMFKKMGFGF